MALTCYFRAIAIDYDGTLTFTPRPSTEVLDALRAVRREGMRLVLVTGRILDHLRDDFPEVEAEFDAIVAENGGVIWTEVAGERALAPSVPPPLVLGIHGARIPGRYGRVLFATQARYAQPLLEQITAAQQEYQLIYNRDALMVLPAGVSKGSGLSEALGELGISHHSVIGIGDAENDHSLMEFCELGVAVANAVPSLQDHADIVLRDPDGWGVTSFLAGPVLRGDVKVRPSRWQIELGTTAEGEWVTIPGSQANVLVVGGSGSGKSYLAGLFVESLSTRGYSVCVLDPEGDHVTLGDLRGIMVVGGANGLPDPDRVATLLQHRFGSVVVDLSRLDPDGKRRAGAAYLAVLQQVRRATGLPHWIVLDEAPQLLAGGVADGPCGPASQGFCLVTHEPRQLGPATLAQMDVVLAVSGGEELLADPSCRPPMDWSRVPLDPLAPGQALLVDATRRLTFQVGKRRRPHVRHWHKYLSSRLPPSARFVFRTPRGPTGAIAANLAEFHHELERASEEALAHHVTHRDFSRWVERSVRDRALARELRRIESRGAESGLERTRHDLVAAIEARYGTPDPGEEGPPVRPGPPRPPG